MRTCLVATCLAAFSPAAPAAFSAEPAANAQALCSLRDPQRAIYRLFPTANSYRSIVGTVGSKARAHVTDRLPFTLHFNELGRHTLYVAYRDAEPLGFVHARSEAGRWGLVEVAWALDLELRIQGLEYQRCRDRAKRQIDDKAPEHALKAMGFRQLRELLDAAGGELRPGALSVPESARALAAVTVKNGLKTIAVTESVWPAEVWRIRAEAMAFRQTQEKAAARFLPDALPAAADPSLGIGDGVQRSATGVWRCEDPDGDYLGSVVRTPWVAGEDHADVLWWVNADHQVGEVFVRSQDSSDGVKAAFVAMDGWKECEPGGCSRATELVATFAIQCAVAASRMSDEGPSKSL